MTKPLPRAILFAVLALLAWAGISMIASIIIVGLPAQGESISAYQARLATPGLAVDLAVGAIVMLVFGWLAARPFRGRDAILAALLFAAVYVLVEYGFAWLFSDPSQIDLLASVRAYAVKIAAALLGGWWAGRRPVLSDRV